MKDFVSKFSDKFVNMVNSDIIKSRQNERTVEYINDLCKEIAKLYGSEVEYLGYESNDKITQLREINKTKTKKSFKGIVLSTEETYARAYNFKFKLNFKGEIRKITMLLYVPLIFEDGANYYVKGNKYCTPFQLVDAVTYNRVDSKNKYDEVCLKTSTQDIKMQRFHLIIKDINEESYNVNRYNIKLNNKIKNVPFLLFYFATFGFFRTLKYFNIDNPIVGVRLFKELPDLNIWKDFIFFKYGKLYMSVRREIFLNSSRVRDLVGTIISTKKKNIYDETIKSVDFWTMMLGSFLSQNNTLSSGHSLKLTFSNALDPRTTDLLDVFVGKKDLNTTYSVVRWMFDNYSINVSKDSSLVNKRLSLSEVLIHPLKQKLLQKYFSYSRSHGGYRDIKRLEDGFIKVNPSIILDNLIGKTGLATSRYSNVVNDFSLLSITKTTQTGPGSVGAKSSHVPREFRRLHPSMIGRVDLISTSVNNPGSSLNILPNCPVNLQTLGFGKVKK